MRGLLRNSHILRTIALIGYMKIGQRGRGSKYDGTSMNIVNGWPLCVKYTAAGDLKAEKKKYRQSRELSRRKIASLR